MALSSPERLDGFDAFWQKYPVKVAKIQAMKAWGQLNPPPELRAVLMANLDAQLVWHSQPGWKPRWPYPATWIRGKRWEDVLQIDPETLKQATWHRQQIGRCPHDPECESYHDCVRTLALRPR